MMMDVDQRDQGDHRLAHQHPSPASQPAHAPPSASTANSSAHHSPIPAPHQKPTLPPISGRPSPPASSRSREYSLPAQTPTTNGHRPNGSQIAYPSPSPQEVSMDALLRLQTQVQYNTAGLQTQRRDFETLSHAVSRLSDEMGRIENMVQSLRRELQARPIAPAAPAQAPPGSQIDDATLNLFVENLSSVASKVGEVDTLKMQLEIVKRRIKIMEEDSAPSGPPLNGAAPAPAPAVGSFASPREAMATPMRYDPVERDGRGYHSEDVREQQFAAAATPTTFVPYNSTEQAHSEDNWRSESQRAPSSAGKESRRGRGGARGRGRRSLPADSREVGDAPEWENPSWNGNGTQPGPNGYYHMEIGPDGTKVPRGSSIVRRGSGGNGPIAMRPIEMTRPTTGGDPYAHTKKTRTKPIRNADGILIRKDGRPDMRSQSSAANLRKVHARKEQERILEQRSGTPTSGLASTPLNNGSRDGSHSNGSTPEKEMSPANEHERHEAIMKQVFPNGVDQIKAHKYHEQYFPPSASPNVTKVKPEVNTPSERGSVSEVDEPTERASQVNGRSPASEVHEGDKMDVVPKRSDVDAGGSSHGSNFSSDFAPLAATTTNIAILTATAPAHTLYATMRAATPQALGWLRALVRRELRAPALQSASPRPSRLRARASAATPTPRPHARAFSTTASRPQDPRPSSSSSPSPTAETAAPAAQHTHYTFFPKTLPAGPPPAGPFAIDLRALRNEFLQLQASAHPDRHGGADKRRAEGLSARINEAYRTLQNPLLRAQHLLSLRGIDVAEDERLKVEDPELLMEVLEARERIEEAGSEEEVQAMRVENGRRVEGSVEVLDRAFREDDVETAKEEAVRLRYWVNIKESLDAWEPGKPVVLQH
ncbi:putative fe-s protein assembly co-chaperone protein [Neofusicoccum parvum UCRNP2]|uniref:Putative fe-s protein assembly co-chaperone protein n=1 Tax=Botryosphaeria parva (strain UCR-NP2) TaxID=1287680 RepID=R1EQ85_BOTPV|nr:putative fe-s protein assembly co-chaperone protein [Neofusicoccum parvum UCRNP2]